VSIEFIPENKEGINQIYYEVKIGGASRSFYRRSSLGSWNIPPHHYCLYVTALVDKNIPAEPEDEETFPAITLKSRISKEPYSIFVRLPEAYQSNIRKKYPVVYHVDGNAFFDPISSSLDRLTKKKKISSDAIVVGIGYENAYVMDSLRNRDYTFPKDSFLISGGGESFYHFIKTELTPYIDMTYRTDTTNRTLMGHSLGGYFVLYALVKEIECNGLFNNYVAASPSLWYHDYYILKQFQNPRSANNNHRTLRLYLTAGEMEVAEDPDNSFNYFEKILGGQDLIQLKSKIYRDLEHMGTAVPSFEDGLELVLSTSRF
jgi:predicted alpha/beta superfamily hydrolase